MLALMSTILVRRLDAQVHATLRQRAKDKGVSLEAEVRDILTREAATEMKKIDWSQFTTVDSGNSGHVTREYINQSYEPY
jgi:plasmid stability protein